MAIARSAHLVIVALLLTGGAHAQERRVADAKYWTAVGAAASAGLTDAIQSKQWRHSHPLAYEMNPLLGRHPGWPQTLGVGAAFHGGAAFASYEMKKRGWRLWWLPQLVLIGAHAYGTATTRH